ncbi:MAG TPA: glycosyltransferase [Microlunatus sp.]
MPKLTVSVVVPVIDLGAHLKTLVRSLDTQDLPYDRYRVIFVDLGSSDGTQDRLADVAAHRPNVDVLAAADQKAAWNTALEHVDTEYTVLLSAGDRLHPWGLTALLNRADEAFDVVLGRSAGTGPIGFVPETAYTPWNRDHPDAAIALLAPTALIRTDLLRDALSSSDTGWRAARIKLLSVTDSIAALTDPPVAVGAGPGAAMSLEEVWRDADVAAQGLDGVQRARFIAAHAAASVRRRSPALSVQSELITEVVRRHAKDVAIMTLAPSHRAIVTALLGADGAGQEDVGLAAAKAAAAAWSDLKLKSTTTASTWQEGLLQLELSVRLVPRAGSEPAGLDELEPVLLLRKPSGSEAFRVPATVEAQGDTDGFRTFKVTAAIDIATAAGGRPLSPGIWHPSVRLDGTGSDLPVRDGVTAIAVAGAIIDGVPIAPYADNRQLYLDVGAGKHGVFGSYKPTDASMTETVEGSLLTIRLPDLAVRGEATLPGKLYQGKFPLPATLHADADGARIDCYVSGLAGVSPLSGQFPPATQQALGLQLRIGDAGDFSVESIPAAKARGKKSPATKAAPTKSAAKKAASATPAAKKAASAKGTAGKSAPKQPGQKSAAARSTTKPYPSAADSPNLVQQVLPIFKPVGKILPKPVRTRARRAYRKLIK